LIITRQFPPYRGGSENYIWEVYSRLVKTNKVDVITYQHPKRERNGNIHEIFEFSKSMQSLEFINYVLNAFKKSFSINFDVIHAVTYVSGIAAILPRLVSGKPLVLTIHDIGVIEKDVKNVSPITKAVKGFLQGIACSSADAIIVPSEKVRNDIIKYHNIERSKIFITNYGIDTDVYNPKIKPDVIKKKFNLKDQVILYIGMYSQKKGLEYLIEAIKEAKKAFPKLKLLIVGQPIPLNSSYDKKIRKLVSNLDLEDSVKFTGFIEEKLKPNVYKDADIVVEPSMYGMGYSFACIEASAVGKPIIATTLLQDIGVIKDNVSGIVVPLRDSASIANAIVKLLKDKNLYSQISKSGIEFAKKFNWDECAKLTEDIYKKVEIRD
jgi:glycosyltransferase involved in cell wall biosynthesis